jgi:hypothetical protein
MTVLGAAIANHLAHLEGLYSVELPESLTDELVQLVESANTVNPNRAVFIADDDPPGLSVPPVRWRELLSWRTTDDRVFVWKRGAREPDTSFRSAVKPFISNRFPGAGGGECTSEFLVRLSMTELWRRRELTGAGHVFEAFVETAGWLMGVLRQIFEKSGSTPSTHWSDRYLQHWAGILTELDRQLEIFASPPLARHAWELVRLSGLPLPSSLVDGNPFLEPPRKLDEKDWKDLARLWADVVDSYVIPQGGIALLLTALDSRAIGEHHESSWRALPWDATIGTQADTPAPVVGAKVFVSHPSPTLISENIPAFPIAPLPSWWGVTSSDLEKAVDYLRKETPLQVDPNGAGLLKLFPSGQSLFVLNTRSGLVSHGHTAKKWKTRVTVDDVRLRFREDWRALHLSSFQPSDGAPGDAWIDPDSITITPKGAKESSRSISQTLGEQLQVTLGLHVDYSAALSADIGSYRGRWNSSRTLKVGLTVKRFMDGQWDGGRTVTEEVRLVIPSPFSPTVVVMDEEHLSGLAPDGQDDFSQASPAPDWAADSTPTILLGEEGRYSVAIYDGTLLASSPGFSQIRELALNGIDLGVPSSGLYPSMDSILDEGDLLTSSGSADVVVFKVKERSSNLSSGLLSAVRGLPAGRKQPSAHARNSVLGQYQTVVTRSLCAATTTLNSLFQYVIGSSDAPSVWGSHPGTPLPAIALPSVTQGFSLPGLGAGPTAELVRSLEWTKLMGRIDQIRLALGLKLGSEDIWLSGLDLSVLPADLVRAYCMAHRDLIRVAELSSAPADHFWASYPFSVLVVEGRGGASFGQLLAVLLSPLHPARLAWAYSVVRIAKASNADSSLLGLLEGWNLPCTGIAFNPAGQQRPLVSIPIDPGPEQDFAAWGALAVLSDNGLADLPAFGAGQSLPWGGPTGINARVVERALRDYFVVHPHLNSLELDIRSVSLAPRSQEIDAAVLSLVGVGDTDSIQELGGATRVWDSELRLGSPPTRDDLFALRGDMDRDQPFEWRTYSQGSNPVDADIAIVENASVHLAIVDGDSPGVLGLLPLRRFSPVNLRHLTLDQHYRPIEGEDLLGLGDLLREMEARGSSTSPALRATPQIQALGIGQGARWEVLGTFNLDPALLASVVAFSPVTSGTRLLWEWRPSWMSTDKKAGDLARRPYYVVARIPASLLAALESRQGFSTQNANELLRTLGQHGVGLAALTAEGGTQESAAAGFFYAVRLLLPIAGGQFSARLSTGEGVSVLGVLPVDPLEPMLQGIAGKKLERRSDLFAISMGMSAAGELKLCFVPIEVKHHGMPAHPEPIPRATDRELKRAREQLAQTASLVKHISQVISGTPSQDPTGTYLKRLAIATMLDLAMSFAPIGVAADVRARILRTALSGRLSIGVGDGVLLWFAPGTMQSSGAACVIDRYGPTVVDGTSIREIYLDPHALPGLWWSAVQPGPNEVRAKEQVDEALLSAFDKCSNSDTAVADSLAVELRAAFDLPEESQSAVAIVVPSVVAGGSSIMSAPNPNETAVVVPQGSPEASLSETVTHKDGTFVNGPSPEPEAVTNLPDAVERVPRAIVGWTAPAMRWAIVGSLAGTKEMVALDLDNPKTIGVYGYMGSGKSYLLGTMIESAVKRIPGVNALSAPLAVVVFNYRRNSSDRFELASLSAPNQDQAEVERLRSEYGATPTSLDDMHVLCLPGELRADRLKEYGNLAASELFFDPRSLSAEDWELLMGEPGSDAVFARTIRNTLVDLRSAGEISLDLLEQQVASRLTGQSRAAARLRFDFVRRYISAEVGTDFSQLVRAGRVLIVDLRQPLFNKDDALRFFLVCANQISKVQGRFNKMIVFDEAHEYVSAAFGERMESRIRLMRHEGTSYVFATQDVQSIPLSISRFLTTRFVFDLGTRENVQDLEQVAPEFRGYQLRGMRPGHCFVHASTSANDTFRRPREITVRPRATQHGGTSQIFSTDADDQGPGDSR